MELIIGTSISGCGEKEFLTEWEKLCEKHKKRVKVFHTGELMFKHFEAIGEDINKDNVLNMDRGRLQTARSAVLKGILAEITDHEDKYDAVVICMHMWFYWKEIYHEAYDRFLKKFLKKPKSTMFVTFINDFRPILARLKGKKQWEDQKLNSTEILKWQNLEVGSTSQVADFANIRFQVVPVGQSPSEFYKLVFHPEIEVIYVGMPISHFRQPEDRVPIDEFIKKLSKYFTVVNPLTVEIVGAIHFEKNEPEEHELAVHHHIAHRDLYWFVGLCDKMVAYWPKVVPPEIVRNNPEILKLWPKAIASPGLNCEMKEAHNDGKDVWTVFLGSEASPFIISDSTKLFLDENEFFEFLEKRYPERAKKLEL